MLSGANLISNICFALQLNFQFFQLNLNDVVLCAVSWATGGASPHPVSKKSQYNSTRIMVMMMMMIYSYLMHMLAGCTVRDDYHIKAELLQKELNELQQKVCYIHCLFC